VRQGRACRPRNCWRLKNARPIQSLDDLAADIFESDEELGEFLAFTYAERHRDLA
jgi:hypothetical protein